MNRDDIEPALRRDTAHARTRLARELSLIWHAIGTVETDLGADSYSAMPGLLSDVAAAAARAALEVGRLASLQELKESLTEDPA